MLYSGINTPRSNGEQAGAQPQPQGPAGMCPLHPPRPPQLIGLEHGRGELPAHLHKGKPKARFPSAACLLGAKP